MTPILEIQNLSHVYSEGTPFEHAALQDVSLSIARGEFVGLIGHTGSGKSTLIQHFNGLLKPTSGKILFDGADIWQDPKFTRAIRFKVGLVFQYPEHQLFEETVYKDISFGPKNMGLSEEEIRVRVERAAQFVGITNTELEKSPFDLSGGQKRRVAIAGVIAMEPDVLILDEPTAVLVPQEIEELVGRLNELRAMGKTIVIITHKLDEVKLCADRITVIRRGKVVGTLDNDEKATPQVLANMMVGRPVLLTAKRSEKPVGEKVLLSVRHLTAKNSAGKPVLKDISFDIHEGEILGVAGVDGNGQSELMFQLTGLMEAMNGEVVLDGENVFGYWPDALRARGVGIIPEDRYRQGVCLPVAVSQNLVAGYHGREPFSKGFRMNYKAVQENYTRLVQEYDIRLSNQDPPVGALSGGNAQKVIVAREFSQNPKLLYASQPTRGVDVGATEFIHERLLRSRDEGKAILLISSELSEVVGLSDRLVVMYEGEITGEFRSADVTYEELGLYMSGAKRQERKEAQEHGQSVK